MASEKEAQGQSEAKVENESQGQSEATSEKEAEVRYESIEELPDSLRSTLPEEAQEVYLEAYQESWDTYEEYQGGELGRAAVAHRDGWNVMSKQFVKHPSSGKWYPVDELPDDEEAEEDEGLIDQVKDIF